MINDIRPALTRRRFLTMAGSTAAATLLSRSARISAAAAEKPRQRKTILSFYCDDTGPYVAGAAAFRAFLDYCAEQKIAGESSLILGMGGRCMTRKPTDEEHFFLKQVGRAWECGIDTHMELMTHRGLFDFEANRERKGSIHEGLWLHEPEVAMEEYERYFLNIITEGERAGIKFSGLTWPGCGCEACKKRYAELRARGLTQPSAAVWQALLRLASKGKFRHPTVPCFFGSSETDFGLHRKAGEGKYAVYDLMPNARDCFGIWENNRDRVNPDYYITANGKSGIIVRHVEARAPYCVWYAHWQGLNPAKGVGWRAFVTVVERIRQHLRDRVVWLRPSDVTERYHAAGNWTFLESQ
jgi:hypothetical protein